MRKNYKCFYKISRNSDSTHRNTLIQDISLLQSIFIATNIKHLTYPHLNTKIPRKIQHDQHYKNV